MYCPYCGTEVAVDERVCKKCGSYVPPSHVIQNQARQRSGGNALRWIFRLIVVIAIGFLALTLFLTRNLFYYSTVSLWSDNPISATDRANIESAFENTFLIVEENEYTVFNPKTGLCLIDKSLIEEENDITVKFTISDKYAYIEMSDPASSDKATVSYFKASIIQRIDFATKYYSWKII